MLITFFSFVMGIYGNLVLGPSVEQWRTFGESMRNLVPMLRRPDAFDWEAAQAVDDTALAVYAPARTPPRPARTLHPPHPNHTPSLRLGRHQTASFPTPPLPPSPPPPPLSHAPRHARPRSSSCAHVLHARRARWGIYPAAGFFFFCAVFTNALVLLNLARAVVIHSYIQTDAQFWHRRPDDVTREPMNLIHYIRQPYEEYRDMMRMRKFRKSQVKGYAMELMVAKGKAREQAQDAIEDERERVRELRKAEKEAAEAAKAAE